MKIIISLILIITSYSVYSQQNHGVYLNALDFRNGQVTYVSDCSNKQNKIKLNALLGKPHVTVMHEGQSYKLLKADIFGYKDCDGNSYRFIGNSRYTILNPNEEILLYKFEIVASKNQSAKTYYKFSTLANHEVYDLTIGNLKNAFADNEKFHDQLTAVFSSSSELTKYDSFYKVYQVNRLYRSSLAN